MPSITVVGRAVVSVSPDRATLDLGLTHVALTASAALDEVARRSGALEQVLSEFRFETTDWSTQGISLSEEWQWANEANTLVGHRATSGITVVITAFERIAPLLKRAVDDVGAQIRQLQWSASAEHPARRSLLAAAAADAVERADAYAGALGLQRGAVEDVSDLPIRSGPTSPPASGMMRAKMVDAAPPMSVNAGELELQASVFVRFTTLPG